jgi:hypothetical protein
LDCDPGEGDNALLCATHPASFWEEFHEDDRATVRHYLEMAQHAAIEIARKLWGKGNEITAA